TEQQETGDDEDDAFHVRASPLTFLLSVGAVANAIRWRRCWMTRRPLPPTAAPVRKRASGNGFLNSAPRTRPLGHGLAGKTKSGSRLRRPMSSTALRSGLSGAPPIVAHRPGRGHRQRVLSPP